MVSQTVHQAVTYYSPKEPEGSIVRNAPLQGEGRAWILGAYEHPSYPSPLNVRVGTAGVKVWMVIQWLQLSGDDKQKVLERYGGVLQPGDIDVAEWYYHRNEGEIDLRISEENHAA